VKKGEQTPTLTSEGRELLTRKNMTRRGEGCVRERNGKHGNTDNIGTGGLTALKRRGKSDQRKKLGAVMEIIGGGHPAVFFSKERPG